MANLDYVDIFTIVGVVASIVFSTISLGLNGSMRKQEQASRIWAWIEPSGSEKPEFNIVLSNDGSGLVFDVVATVVRVDIKDETGRDIKEEGSCRRVTIPILKPGERRIRIGHLDYSMHKCFGVEVGFVDKFGLAWVRTADGKLKRIRGRKGVLGYYGIGLPVDWTSRI